jgi:hypothetical protein
MGDGHLTSILQGLVHFERHHTFSPVASGRRLAAKLHGIYID